MRPPNLLARVACGAGVLGLLVLTGCQGKGKDAAPAAKTAESPAPAAAPAKAPADPAASAAPAPAPAPTPVQPPPAAPVAAPNPLTEGSGEQMLLLKEGNEALARGETDAALARFLLAFEGPTSGASISAGLAATQLLVQKGANVEAAAAYERLLTMAPEVAEIRFTAGRFFSATGDAARAVTELQKARSLQPDFLPLYPMLGGVLGSTGKQEDAAKLMLDYERRLKRMIDKLADPQERPFRKVPIIDVLALVDDERASRALIAAVASPDVQVRLAAADALTFDAEPAAVEAIAAAMTAETDAVAKRALAASLKRARDRLAASTKAPNPAMPAPKSP